jgi:perosamine synthetase
MKTEIKNRINWSGRGQAYTSEEIEVVLKAMKDSDPLTQGRNQSDFEQKFKDYTGANNAFAVSSCTAALDLAATLCDLGPDDEVIIPAHTYAATAIPFGRTGAKIIWADIDKDTRVITRDKFSSLVTPKTKVIVIVHLYGLVCDMDPIMDLAKEKNLFVVEDAAQSLGATYKGRQAGSIGDFGCFSFHSHKNISTLGEGGMLVVKNNQLAKLVPGLRHNGSRPYEGERPQYWLPAMSNVDSDIEGLWPFNFCLGEVQCALGSKLMERLPTINKERKERALRFIDAMSGFPELVFQEVPDGCEHSWHLLAAQYDGKEYGKSRDNLIEILNNKYGVRTVVQYYPLYRYPLFKKAGFGKANCPETDIFFDNMVSFPFQHWMPESEFTQMILRVSHALSELRNRNEK